MAKVSADTWAKGDAYERYMGRWSRLVAREFLEWLALPPGVPWLDVGSGTGALTETILSTAEPASIHAFDASPELVAYARARVTDPRVRFAIADAQQLPPPSRSVDAAVSGLVLNFIDDPQAALLEMARIVRLAGVVGVYVWDYAGQMQLLRYFWDAATAIDPGVAELDEASRFSICDPVSLEGLFRDAALTDIESRPIDVVMKFHDFDEYWDPFLGGQGPAPSYLMGLTEDERAALRDRLQSTVPVDADGSINLTARAWAVRGRRG